MSKEIFHIHVYEVSKKFEVDIEAVSPEEAKLKALDLWKKGELTEVKSDCKALTIGFDSKGKMV